MKKLILSALLVVAISSAFAQTAPVSPTPTQPKQFNPDYSKIVTLQVTVPLAILSQHAYTVEHPDFDNSDLSTKNANLIKKGNAVLADSIYSGFGRILRAQNAAWAADTLKQFNSKIKKP